MSRILTATILLVPILAVSAANAAVRELDATLDVKGNVELAVAETRGLLTRFEEVNLKFGEVTSDEEDALRTMICDRLGTDFELPISYVEEIPRSKGGKYEDFKSEIGG